MDKISINRWIF